jgi:hypothetical protein
MTENTTKAVSIPRWAQITSASVILLLICLHLIFPKWAIDSITVTLFVLFLVVWILPWVKSLEIPGGTVIRMRDVEKAQESLAKIDLPRRPQPPTNVRITAIDGVELNKLSLRDHLLNEDPNLALASLRIEIEKRLRDLATKRGFFVQNFIGVSQVTQTLTQNGALDPKLSSSLSEIIALCNRAVHGATVEPEVARRTIVIGEELLSVLDDLLQGRGDENSRTQAGNQ